jgi:crotonyl-CoA reductase
MEQIRDAILQGAPGSELAALPVPDHYRAAFVRREDAGMFEGIESADKDPRKSLHVADVPTPTWRPTRPTSP